LNDSSDESCLENTSPMLRQEERKWCLWYRTCSKSLEYFGNNSLERNANASM